MKGTGTALSSFLFHHARMPAGIVKRPSSSRELLSLQTLAAALRLANDAAKWQSTSGFRLQRTSHD
jgi:hypothetical protein